MMGTYLLAFALSGLVTYLALALCESADPARPMRPRRERFVGKLLVVSLVVGLWATIFLLPRWLT